MLPRLRMIKFVSISVFAFSTFLSNAVSAATLGTQPVDIANVKQIDPSILVDMMYASSRNFVGQKVVGYDRNICYLTKTAGEALKRSQARLKAHGKKTGQDLSLLLRDCYRPQKAVKQFVVWAKDAQATETKNTFYPDLSKAQLLEENYISPESGHSRGSSIDVTIARRDENGEFEELPMGSIMDFFGKESHTRFSELPKEAIDNRRLLLKVLLPEFKNYSKEWWHFALVADPYPTTFFDFDIKELPVRQPQSLGAEDFATQISSPRVIAELDRTSDSPLSLFNLLVQLHKANGIVAPTVATHNRASGKDLAMYKETYLSFSNVMASDIAKLTAELGIDWEKDITKTYDPASAKTNAGKEHRKNGNVVRIFNERWLTSEKGQFILAGVVNRIDRRDFTQGTCGEIRFVYRLGYETQMKDVTYASRVPFTLNFVFNYKDDGHNCSSVANEWRRNANQEDVPSRIAEQLLAGPIDFSKLIFKQMEMNAQVARFPSDLENVEQRKFAGQAIYLMRIFQLKDGVLKATKLENTPDVQGILKSSEKQQQLKDFISKNLAAIDAGVYLMPDNLLADVALSYSTFGSSRTANKPFDLLLKPGDAEKLLAKASANELKFIANGRGLLERLNMSTCMGCHQSSSTAGFHFLGLDRHDFGSDSQKVRSALDGNRLVLPFSNHLFADLPRRAQYVADLANRVKANTFRPHPSAPPAAWSNTSTAYSKAGDNMPCPLPNENALGTSTKWSCDEARGLQCVSVIENAAQSTGLGQCIPKRDHIYSGLSCRKNTLNDATVGLVTGTGSNFAFNVRSFSDRVATDQQLYALPEGPVSKERYNCRPTKIGVPLGRVTKSCTLEQMSLKNTSLDKVPNEICAVVGGKGFEEMAKGYFNSQRFAEGVGRGMLNTCSPTRFCREDYICQEMPDFLTGKRFNVSPATITAFRRKKVGFCTPTYFVYQLRLDGHPNP